MDEISRGSLLCPLLAQIAKADMARQFRDNGDSSTPEYLCMSTAAIGSHRALAASLQIHRGEIARDRGTPSRFPECASILQQHSPLTFGRLAIGLSPGGLGRPLAASRSCPARAQPP